MPLPTLLAQLFVDGVWTTYTATLSDGWRTQIGPDIETGNQPNTIGVTLANDDQSMDPSNVSSALYGKIGQNTPLRVTDNGTTLTRAEASVWQPDNTPEYSQSTGRGRAWVAVSAGGVLQRLGRWEDPISSAIRRQIGMYSSLTGYWPLEDDTGSQVLEQVVAGGQPGAYSGAVTLAGDPGAGGSDATLLVGNPAWIGGAFIASSASGYQICFSARLNALPSSATYGTFFLFVDTQGRTYSWQWNNTSYRTVVTDSSGAALDTSVIAVQPILTWTRYRIKVTVSGGTITYEPAWYTQDAGTPSGITSTFAGTVTGQPKAWSGYGNSFTDGSSFGHVFAVTDTALDLLNSGDARDAFNGYLGERAGYRFNRLAGEAGIARYVNNAALSVPMGRQKSGRLLDLLQQCADSDGGIIYDEPLDIALTMRTNYSLINKSVALALTKGVDVAPPLLKLIGDVGTANDITVNNADGTTVRLEQTAGPRSVNAPPSGVGRYRKPLNVNLLTLGHVANRGNWELVQGTLNRPRYKQVVINLLASPSQRSAVNGLRPGDIVSITSQEPDIVYLQVMTIERSGSDMEDKAVLSCLPADVWFTGKWDDTAWRLDSATTTLGSTVTTTGTSFTFSFTIITDAWSTTGVPYDVIVAGERITVTAMGAVSGSGPWTQTATVTRSVNGVVKALNSGEQIHVFRPYRYSLGGY